MSGRRALVIGSQCAALNQLSFLPRAAENLYAVFTDPVLGGCQPALPDREGLLLNPTQDELMSGLWTAFGAANTEESTLFVAFVGHGQVGSAGAGLGGFEDFYLLPFDCADPDRPTTYTAWLLGQGLRELLRTHDRLDGLVVVVDACHSGQGAVEAARLVSSVAAAAQIRFEILSATDDRTRRRGVSPGR